MPFHYQLDIIIWKKSTHYTIFPKFFLWKKKKNVCIFFNFTHFYTPIPQVDVIDFFSWIPRDHVVIFLIFRHVCWGYAELKIGQKNIILNFSRYAVNSNLNWILMRRIRNRKMVGLMRRVRNRKKIQKKIEKKKKNSKKDQNSKKDRELNENLIWAPLIYGLKVEIYKLIMMRKKYY